RQRLPRKPSCPPICMLRWQPTRYLLPHSLPVVFPGIRHRHRVQRRKHRLDPLHLTPAFPAFLQVHRDFLAILLLAISISNQFFFCPVSHDSVPIARAVRCSANGSNARRSFPTARNTVFFVAFAFDFSTSAIS